MENDVLKKVKRETKVIDIVKILGLTILSIFLSIMLVKNIKHFSYEEVDATLISYGEIIRNNENSDSCIGTFEYYVDNVKYDASFSINYQYCFKGYKTKIYYDKSDPKIYSNNKSIFLLIVFFAFDGLSIFALLYLIKEFLAHSKYNASIPHHTIENNNSTEDTKSIELDSNIYGKYMLKCIPNDSDKTSCDVDMKIIKPIPEHPLNIFKIIVPKEIINTIFETNQMNSVLDAYFKIELNDSKKIMEKLINQEIKTLSTWCEVSILSDGKENLIKYGSMISTEIEIDKLFNIVKVYWTYSYNNVESCSLTFSYDVKTGKIDSLDVWH